MRKRRSALEGGEKKRKTRRKQTLVADKPVCLQRTKKIISGVKRNLMIIRRGKIIIYIVSCPSFCLSFCKVRKEKKKPEKKI